MADTRDERQQVDRASPGARHDLCAPRIAADGRDPAQPASGPVRPAPDDLPRREPPDGSPPIRRGRHARLLRGRRRWAAVFLIFLALSAGTTARLFVFPAIDAPARADAIVMFDGVGSRHDAAIALARAGYAPVLAISTQDPRWCRRTKVSGVQVLCFVPEPATTRGEAEATADLAARHHWRTVLVVVGRPQVTRARVRLERCYHDKSIFIAVDPALRDWPTSIAYEWGALLKAVFVQRDC